MNVSVLPDDQYNYQILWVLIRLVTKHNQINACFCAEKLFRRRKIAPFSVNEICGSKTCFTVARFARGRAHDALRPRGDAAAAAAGARSRLPADPRRRELLGGARPSARVLT